MAASLWFDATTLSPECWVVVNNVCGLGWLWSGYCVLLWCYVFVRLQCSLRFAATAAAASAAAVQEAATMQGGDKKKLEITRSRLSYVGIRSRRSRRYEQRCGRSGWWVLTDGVQTGFGGFKKRGLQEEKGKVYEEGLNSK